MKRRRKVIGEKEKGEGREEKTGMWRHQGPCVLSVEV